MASLTAHLRRAGDHGRLAFHPQCPVCCRERLAGTLPADAFVGRRTQAVLAAGVLALSTATPAAVLAAEPDQEQEGAAAPDQAANADPGSDPDFDPGGESTELPFDAGPAPRAEAAPEVDDHDAGGLEPEPAANEDAPIADAGDGARTPNTGRQPPSPTTDPHPAPPAAPTPAPPSSGAPPSAPTLEPPVATPAPAKTDATAGTRPRKQQTARKRQAPNHASAPAHTERAAPAPEPQTQPVPVDVSSGTSAPTKVQVAQAQPAPSLPAAGSQGQAARRGDRFHVVVRGESLWSIAKDLLGDGASPARIAREVNRLWELNRDRIATGDRDLLMAGTKLALR